MKSDTLLTRAKTLNILHRNFRKHGLNVKDDTGSHYEACLLCDNAGCYNNEDAEIVLKKTSTLFCSVKCVCAGRYS